MKYCGERLELNFERRYKWAFRSEYREISSAVVAPPDLDQFLAACAAMLEVSLPCISFEGHLCTESLAKG